MNWKLLISLTIKVLKFILFIKSSGDKTPEENSKKKIDKEK